MHSKLTLILFLAGISLFLPSAKSSQVNLQDETTALAVLETRCNSCHKVFNRKMRFNAENMGLLSGKINEEVFIKKRMPLGKGNQLSDREQETLRNWIKLKNNRP